MFEEKRESVQGAGNVCEEIQELKKMIPHNDEMEVYTTTTRNCEWFYTLHCC